jgi:hypothetical protein
VEEGSGLDSTLFGVFGAYGESFCYGMDGRKDTPAGNPA